MRTILSISISHTHEGNFVHSCYSRIKPTTTQLVTKTRQRRGSEIKKEEGIISYTSEPNNENQIRPSAFAKPVRPVRRYISLLYLRTGSLAKFTSYTYSENSPGTSDTSSFFCYPPIRKYSDNGTVRSSFTFGSKVYIIHLPSVKKKTRSPKFAFNASLTIWRPAWVYINNRRRFLDCYLYACGYFFIGIDPLYNRNKGSTPSLCP